MASTTIWAETQTSTPEDLIDALNKTFGRHPGARASHAKGFFAVGTFTPAPDAAESWASPVFANGPRAADLRLSIGGGNPKASDKGRSVRGLAAKIHLPDESTYDLITFTAPTFFASTLEQFLAFLAARQPDPATGKPDAARVKAFNDANPNLKPHLDFLATEPVPASYATARYFANHAFLFRKHDGTRQAARIYLEPAAGVIGLSAAEESAYPDDFLQDELTARLADGTVSWDIKLILPKPGDSLVDPASPWPLSERAQEPLGRLSIVALAKDDARRPIVFDPSHLPDGIEPTDDPIFAARSPAYAVSVARRSE